jgi:hypothetical protein
MTIKVIGSGFGRTGTLSLHQALERLGYGNCFHMNELIADPSKMPAWIAAAADPASTDWDAIFAGYNSTVDWPAAAYWRELADYYPDAKVIHTVRDPQRWFDSTQATIFSPVMLKKIPPLMLEMCTKIVYSLFDHRIHDRDHAISVYEQHTQTVIDTIPADRLLMFDVRDGWEPLCRFLGHDVPDEAFPRANDVEELWDNVERMTGATREEAAH